MRLGTITVCGFFFRKESFRFDDIFFLMKFNFKILPANVSDYSISVLPFRGKSSWFLLNIKEIKKKKTCRFDLKHRRRRQREREKEGKKEEEESVVIIIIIVIILWLWISKLGFKNFKNRKQQRSLSITTEEEEAESVREASGPQTGRAPWKSEKWLNFDSFIRENAMLSRAGAPTPGGELKIILNFPVFFFTLADPALTGRKNRLRHLFLFLWET